MRFSFALFFLLACGSGGPGETSDAGLPDASPPPTFAEQATVSELASFQTVKVDLMKDGVDVAKLNAPIVSLRPTLLRAYVTVAKGWKPALLDAELDVSSGGQRFTFTDSKKIHKSSSDDDIQSTFDFAVPEALVRPGTSFSLTVWRDDTGEPISYPSNGTSRALPATDGGFVHVVLVPIQYDADGSHRLPNLSDAQLTRFHDTLYKMYPTRLVQVGVHAPLPWDQVIDPMGSGWDEVLTAVADLRAADAPAENVYYVAAFEPATTVGSFCNQGGCILGVAPLAGPDDVDLRVAAVLGYTGQLGPNTLLQELAHAMGRDHADCGGAAAPDPKFPYPGAGIGAWGYDFTAQTLVDPTAYFDFMGYCSPVWISDYTYKALFDRITYVSKNVDPTPWMTVAPFQSKKSMRVVHVAPDGSTRLGRMVRITPPSPTIALVVTSRGGSRVVDAPFVRLDHGGGFALLPDADLVGATVRVR